MLGSSWCVLLRVLLLDAAGLLGLLSRSEVFKVGVAVIDARLGSSWSLPPDDLVGLCRRGRRDLAKMTSDAASVSWEDPISGPSAGPVGSGDLVCDNTVDKAGSVGRYVLDRMGDCCNISAMI